MTPEPDEHEVPASHGHGPVPSDRANLILAVVAGVLVVVVVLLFGARLYVLSENQHDSDATNAAQDEALREANRRLENAGEPTVAVRATPEPGEPGASGEPGEEGAEGPAGDTGPDGPPGPEGKRGPRGFTGLDGPAGVAGVDGRPGETGPAGQQGQQGPAGTKGETGPKGEPGQPGHQGETGPAGTAVPGNYQCPAGQVLTGFTVSANGDVSIACEPQILPRR